MAYGGYYTGGDVGYYLSVLESNGFFSLVLPFLLIFAVIFGILQRVKIFEQKGINGIIALVVGLMSLQFQIVPRFFSEVFPRLGVGLSVILTILILAGLFLDPKNKGMMLGMFAVSVVIIGVVLINAGLGVGSGIAFWWADNWGWIVWVVIFLIVIGIMFAPDEKTPDVASPLAKLLGKI